VIATPGETLEAINGRPVINGWLVPHCYVGPFKYEGRDAQLFVEYLDDRSYLTLYEDPPDEQTCDKPGDECGAGLACRAGICGILQGPFHAAPGEAWVMGDNRNNSHDSRSWRGGLGGGVPFENIKGRAMFVWMSFAPNDQNEGHGFWSWLGIAPDRVFVNVMGRPVIPAGQDPSLDANLAKCLRERPSVSQTTPPAK
jgi:signal peptidase I